MNRIEFGATFAFVTTLVLSAWVATPTVEAQSCAPNCWTIQGRVLGPQSEPVANVDIDLFPAGGGTEILLSGDSTDADGNFTLTIEETIPAGFYDLHLQPSPGVPYFPTVIFSELIAGPHVLSADLIIDVGSFVTGRVIDDLGVGIGEIDLNFFIAGTSTELLFSGDLTDANGDFEVLVIPDDYDIVLRTTVLTVGGPYVEVFLENQPLDSSLPLGDVTFHAAQILTGIVRDEGGQPVAAGDLDVSDPITEALIFTPGDSTDASGVFSILVPEGTWKLEIDPPSGSTLVAQLIDAVVPAGGANLGIINLPVGVTVSGTTVDGGGTPVPEVDLDFDISATGIEIATAHDNADPTGNFSVQVVPNTYDIQFRPPFISGLTPLVMSSVVVATNVNIGSVQLVPGPALTGTITTGGTPVKGAEVNLTDSTTGAPVYTFGDKTNVLGQYSLRQVSGTYDVTFIPPVGSGLPTTTQFDVDFAGDTTLDHDFSAISVPAVTGVACVSTSTDVTLDWTLGAPDYDAIEIARDGVGIATLSGTASTFTDLGLTPGTYQYEVVAQRSGIDSAPAECTAIVSTLPTDEFLRGDPNDSGTVDIADAVLTLDYLFAGPVVIRCLDSLDANDAGDVNIADPVYILAYLFSSGPNPLAPFPIIGVDPTPDTLPDCL